MSLQRAFVRLLCGYVGLSGAIALAGAPDDLLGDLAKAPPPFGFRTGSAVPVDMDSVEIDMVFDAATSTTIGKAHIVFKTGDAGMPFFDMVPDATDVKLDGASVPASDFAAVNTPGSETKVRVLARHLAANTTHTIDLEYAVPQVTYTSGKVQAGFFMSDLAASGREFFEQYGPANLEFDQVRYTFHVRIEGTAAEHEVFANGVVTNDGPNAWTIAFPSYFTTSSLYFHMSEVGRFNVQRYVFDGLEADIPVTVYSTTSSLTQTAVSRSRTVLTELEGTYGAFAHAQVVIYVTPGGGGMEYGGATMTSTSALGHELTHSYFARGVMPANGNSGWIDEAVASWRDNGYPRASGAPNRSSVNMGGFTAYRRHTSQLAYTSGATLISEFDYMFRGNGGMKSILRQLYSENKLTTITLGFFKSFMERATSTDLTAIFNRYVLGSSTRNKFTTVGPVAFESAPASHHPRPYTKAELQLYR